MVNGLELLEAIETIASEKQIEREVVLSGIVEGFQKAFEKFFDTDAVIDVKIDETSGEIKVFQDLTVVSKVEDDWLEINLKDANKEFGKDIQVGDIVKRNIEFNEDFSRIAVFQVRQIFQQKIRAAERGKVYEKFIDKKGEIIKGKIIGMNDIGTSYMVEIDGTQASIQNSKIIRGESFSINEYVNFYVEDIEKDNRISQVVLSRTHPQFLVKLLEQEVPEVYEGIVEIKACSREAGKRAKVAVISNDSNIEPIGTVVGSRGSRINAVSAELKDEKIDVILWSENKEEFIMNGMAPVRVISVGVDEENGEADVVVPNEQLSLAIGKMGIAARLVASLIKIRINIVSLDLAKEDAIEILWNGNITETELNDPSFLENIRRRKEKTNNNFSTPRNTSSKGFNKNNNHQDIEAQLKALQEEILNGEDDFGEDFTEEQMEKANFVEQVMEEIELEAMKKEVKLDEIEANIQAFEALDEDMSEDDEEEIITDEYDDYYEN